MPQPQQAFPRLTEAGQLVRVGCPLLHLDCEPSVVAAPGHDEYRICTGIPRAACISLLDHKASLLQPAHSIYKHFSNISTVLMR